MYHSYCPKCNSRFADRTPASADRLRDMHMIESHSDGTIKPVREGVRRGVLRNFQAVKQMQRFGQQLDRIGPLKKELCL